MKAAELGDSKLKLKIGEEMEKEGRVTEYMRLYWAASDLGEAEATTRLAAIYEKGEIARRTSKNQRD